uniref:Uncharacterized protein n=1 Tax=Physcomitrium patens TaxID=3218 RepID=A0A2K1IE24_PHYPA|nr:hypothetical protein PHYPA_029683 [Physcomitrium patens]
MLQHVWLCLCPAHGSMQCSEIRCRFRFDVVAGACRQISFIVTTFARLMWVHQCESGGFRGKFPSLVLQPETTVVAIVFKNDVANGDNVRNSDEIPNIDSQSETDSNESTESSTPRQ